MRKISTASALILALLTSVLCISALAVKEVDTIQLVDKPIVKAAKNYSEILAILDSQYVVQSNFEYDEVTEEESVVSDGILGSGGDFSQTNVQTQGVDEADIVKTDGKYIFSMRQIANTGYRFTIVETDGGNMREIVSKSFVSSDGGYLWKGEMYITPTRAVLLFSENMSGNRMSQTTAMIYDISDRDNVTLSRQFVMSGAKQLSRMIDGNLYLATSQGSYWRKEKSTLADLPAYGDKSTAPIAATDIYYMPNQPATSFWTLVGINVHQNNPASVKSIMLPGFSGQNFYASLEHLYFSNTKFQVNNLTTELFKFKLKDAKVSYVSAGAVPGNLLNQFSMDEYEGNFRVATTAYTQGSSANNLYVLNANMDTVGSLEGLAPTERIYSVRYDKQMAYMVTFRQTDPLYAIDVSDPTNPVVKGFLKIPGFSSYMHPIGDSLMVGVGQNTDANGRNTGIKLSLFDVSNAQKPKELHILTLGGTGSNTPVYDNHKTLIYDPARKLLCFPVLLSSVTASNTPKLIPRTDKNAELSAFSGYLVVFVDKEKGFAVKDAIPALYNTPRGLRIADVLYVINGDMITSHSLLTYKQLGELKLK